MKPEVVILFRCCLFLVALQCCASFAQTVSDDDAIDASRNALKSRYPWYDSTRDQVRRIDVQPQKDLKNRHSRWEFRRPEWSWPPWLLRTVAVVAAIIGILLFVALVFYMVRVFVAYEGGSAASSSMSKSLAAGQADRTESLPFQVNRPLADFLEEARRHYEAGRFDEAIVYLYSYQLIELDKHQVIRLTKGKTNRQYLREVRRRSGLGKLLQLTMVAFEDVFFGRHSLERRQFESCWDGLDQFHQQLEQAVA